MRIYTAEDEQRIRLQHQIRDWAEAGLLDRSQLPALESELKVPLRRTGRMLRAGLAVFTLIALAAAVGLVAVLFDIDSNGVAATTLLIAAAVSIAAADRLIVAYRLYRHGVEEALAVGGVTLAAMGTGLVAKTYDATDATAMGVGLIAGAGAGLLVYRRFGFVYAAVGAIACAACAPLLLTSVPAPIGTTLSMLVAAGLFVWLRRVRQQNVIDLTTRDAETHEAASYVAFYVLMNLEVSGWLGIDRAAAGVIWFKWTTYLLMWVVPPVALWLGVRDRQRQLIDVSAATFVVTLLTNKLYLGVQSKPWDPIVLGAVMCGAALTLRRWLAAGPGESRSGFMARRVSTREGDFLAAAGVAATAFHPAATSQPRSESAAGFDGGRSGGAGASTEF